MSKQFLILLSALLLLAGNAAQANLSRAKCGTTMECAEPIISEPWYEVRMTGATNPPLPPIEPTPFASGGSSPRRGWTDFGAAYAEMKNHMGAFTSDDVCWRGELKLVAEHVGYSWGGYFPLSTAMRYEIDVRVIGAKTTATPPCGTVVYQESGHLSKYQAMSCPVGMKNAADENSITFCYRELCPNQDEDYTPGFPEKDVAYFYRKEQCPKKYGQQNSCQAGGFGKFLANRNPIVCRTGEKLKTETDYNGPAGLSFTRHFSSMPQLGGAASTLPAWFNGEDVTFTMLEKETHGQLAEVRFGDGGRLIFVGTGTATTLSSSTAAHGSLSKSTGSWVWSSAKGEKYGFGPGGKVTSKTLKNGQVFSYSWEDDGSGNYRLVSKTEPLGRRIQVEYDAQGRMSAVIDPAGQRYRYSYDAIGNLKTVMFPDETPGYDGDNAFKTYLYEDARFPHHLTGIVDENGERYSQYGYDEQGRAILSELGNHAEKVTMEYLETGNSLVQHHQDATIYREKLLVIDRTHGADRVTREEDFPCPGCTTGTVINEYNSNGWLAKTTDRNGNVTSYVRDTNGRETSRTEGVGTTMARTITTSWNSANSQPSVINDGLRTRTHSYNTKGQLTQLTEKDLATSITRITKYTYTTAGNVATVDGARTDVSDITSYTYDVFGNLLTVTNAKGQLANLSNYDAHGKVGSITDPNGLVTTLAYTPRGWLKTRTVGGLTTTFDYDQVGQLKKVTLPDASFIAYEYDAAHRLTAISNTLGERIEYTLDYAGNRIKEEVKAADGSVVLRKAQAFNALNQLTQTLNAANEPVASYNYDANGNLTSTNRFYGPGGETGSDNSSYGYDALNRLNAITDALNGATAFKYDGLDQLTDVTDPKNLTTQYGVDGLGQLKQTTSPDTGVATQTYDSAGNVKTSSNARGHTTSYTYDALNRVTKITYHDGVAVTFGYDDVSGGNYGVGRLTSVTDSSGSTAYRYDQHGRLLRKTQTQTGTAFVTAYAYDSYGRLSTLTTPSGHVIGYRYNNAGHVDALSINGNDELYGLRYQPFGGITSWHWRDGTLHSRSFDLDGRLRSYPLGNQSVTLSYDRAGRLIQAGGALAKQYDYDKLDRLTGTTSAVNQLFAYDANGNRESLTQDGTLNDYTNASSSNRVLDITGTAPRSYSYDAAGNTLSDGLRSYEYNTANRLSRISKGTVTVDNHYNGLGQRVRKVVSGSESGDIRYVYDEAGQTLGEYSGDGSLINEIVYLNEMPVLLIRQAGIYNIQTDQLNTPRAILNSTQTVVWSWDSDAFGATAANEDPDNNGLTLQFNLRFPGQIHDQETGLHYNYFRDYDPVTGRYIESDPIGLDAGPNTYTYVSGNPVMLFDPFGLCAPEECGELKRKILAKYNDLIKELRKYDPIADGAGGFFMRYGRGVTSPGGHYREITNLKRGIKNDIERYNKICKDKDDGDGGWWAPIPRSVDEAANRPTPAPVMPPVSAPSVQVNANQMVVAGVAMSATALILLSIAF